MTHGWSGMYEVEPIEILWVVLDNPNLNEVVKPEASDLIVYKTATSYGL